MQFDIVITTYRRPEYVLAAIKSCLGQGPHLNTIIVVDDGSRDDTGARVAALNDPRIRFHVRSENGGMSMARHTGLALSDADWTIHLDDDWELLPGALDVLAALAERAPQNTVMLGARMVWDHGGVSPLAVPADPIDYDGQIRWRNRRDGLWMDNLCAISRRGRAGENWMPVRFGWYCATLFYLDVARHGLTLYTEQVLAVQHGSLVHTDSRGSAANRLARRRLDAPGGVATAEALIARHGNALVRQGPALAAHIVASAGMYHLLLGERRKAFSCAARAIRVHAATPNAWWVAAFALLGPAVFAWAYQRRG